MSLTPSHPNVLRNFFDNLDMDSLTALGVAGSILGMARFTSEYLSTDWWSTRDIGAGSRDFDRRDDDLSFSSLIQNPQALRLKLILWYDALRLSLSAGESSQSSDILALQEFATSCIQDVRKILDHLTEIEIEKKSRQGDDSQFPAGGSSFVSLLKGRYDESKQDNISRATSMRVRSIIEYAAETLLIDTILLIRGTDVWVQITIVRDFQHNGCTEGKTIFQTRARLSNRFHVSALGDPAPRCPDKFRYLARKVCTLQLDRN